MCVFNVPKFTFFCVLGLDRNKMLIIVAFFAHSRIFLNFPNLCNWTAKHGIDMELEPETNHDRKEIYKDRTFPQLCLDRKL